MNLFTWLVTNKTGKFALSTAQSIGAATVLGVSGLAAYSFLSSPSDVNPDTVFSANDADVVYVAGGGTGPGTYAGSGPIPDGGGVESGIRVGMSRDMRLMNLDAQRTPVVAQTELDRNENNIKAFKMDGQTDGLGMGKNEVLDKGGAAGMGNFSNLQAQIAQIQAQAAAAAAQGGGNVIDAAAAATRTGGNVPGTDAPTGGKFGMAPGMARANGSNLNSTPLQGDGGPGSLRGGSLGGGGNNIPGTESPSRIKMMNMSPAYTADRDAIIKEGQAFRKVDSLEGMRKLSADIAGNQFRSANEGAQMFLASARLSGGVYVDGSLVTTGGGSSNDFKNINLPNLGGVGGAEDIMNSYMEAQNQLREDLRTYARLTEKYSGKLRGWWNWLWDWTGYVRKIIRNVESLESTHRLDKRINEFEKTWGQTPGMEEQATKFIEQVRSIRKELKTEKIFDKRKPKPMTRYEEMIKEYWTDDGK